MAGRQTDIHSCSMGCIFQTKIIEYYLEGIDEFNVSGLTHILQFHCGKEEIVGSM